MSSFEEEDAYLYDEPQAKKQRQNEDQDVSTAKGYSVEPEDAERKEDAGDASNDANGNHEPNGGQENDAEGSEYEEEDDDSDIDIIIDSGSTQLESPQQKAGPYSRITTSGSGTVTNSQGISSAGSANADAGPEVAAIEKAEVAARKGIDLEAVGEWEGQKITEVSLDQFDDKPWRKPGADITDYFNYGFDELTWAAYCSRQDNLRDFNPQKIMRILGSNNPMSMQMMNQGMMSGFSAPPGFPAGFPPGGFPDMMSMGMFPPGMQGFNQMGMGGGNDDDGAYGGNVQGVAGLVANPHPTGYNRAGNDGDDNNTGYNNNNYNNQWNNNNNR